MKELEDVELDQVGLDAVFECEITKDKVKATWYKADKVIKKSDKYDITSEGGIHRLTIKNSVGEDVSEYSIKMEKLVSKAKLTIKGWFYSEVLAS